MKRLLCLILAVFLLFPVYGCQGLDSERAFTFYYPRKDYGFNAQEGKFYDSFIETELREDISYQAAGKIMNVYLGGPLTQTLANPFPSKLTLKEISIKDHTLCITLSDHLSELTGIDLMIACACLSKTGMELTNTSSVQISCETELLDGKKSIILDQEALIINDIAFASVDEKE